MTAWQARQEVKKKIFEDFPNVFILTKIQKTSRRSAHPFVFPAPLIEQTARLVFINECSFTFYSRQ